MHKFRRLVPGDLSALQAHLLGLSHIDRRQRFCAVAPDSVIHRYCASIDWRRSVLIGCFAPQLLGAVHLLWADGKHGEAAEVAISVARTERSKRIGSELLAQALEVARMKGASEVRFICLSENEAMQRLALKLGARLVTDGEQVDGTFAFASRAAEHAAHGLAARI
jgi:RimJ/RimL family protein N-acetyltransferase